MNLLEEDDVVFDAAQAFMDHWEGRLLEIIHDLEAEAVPDRAAIDHAVAKLLAVARERHALRIDNAAAAAAVRRRYAALVGHSQRLHDKSTQPVQDDDVRAIDFECARHLLAAMIGARSRWIGEEEAKSDSDPSKIETWQRERSGFFRQSLALRQDDAVAIGRIIDTLGPVARSDSAAS